MRLTKQTNYAIRLLMYCAANPSTLSNVAQIAKTYNVSQLFLFKVLYPLVEAGFVSTVRGRGGGIKLARPASEISVAEVVKVTEENFSMAECFDNENVECPLIDACGLTTTFKEALAAFFDVLQKTSIADLQRPTYQARLGLPVKNKQKIFQKPPSTNVAV